MYFPFPLNNLSWRLFLNIGNYNDAACFKDCSGFHCINDHLITLLPMDIYVIFHYYKDEYPYHMCSQIPRIGILFRQRFICIFNYCRVAINPMEDSLYSHSSALKYVPCFTDMVSPNFFFHLSKLIS